MNTFTAAMVLAAGRGERMRPLSDVLAKPALPLADGPVIASALGLAGRAGVGCIVVNTWHLGDLMEAAVAAVTGLDVHVEASPEPSLMGTAGGLALARDRGLLGTDGPILVVNGDCLSDLEIAPLLERHTTRRDHVTLALLSHPDPTRWSRVLVDSDGTVTAIRPPGRAGFGESSNLYPGVMAVSREALNHLPSRPGEIPERLWFPALETGRLGGARLSGTWREVGTPSDYLAVIMEQLAGKNHIHHTASVASTAAVDGSLIGTDAKVGKNCIIRGSVMVAGAKADADSRVVGSVLLGRTRAEAGESVEGVFRTGPVDHV